MCKINGVLLIALCVLSFIFAKPALAQVQGTMRYNNITGHMEFYDGIQWYNFGFQLDLGLGNCTRAGSLEYDPLLLLGTYKYCNGSNWVRIVTIPISLYFCIGTRAGTINYDVGRRAFLVCNGVSWANMKGAVSSSQVASLE